jgi:hypothetical protein
MEHLFSPCTRLYDLVWIERQNRLKDFDEQSEFLEELNLDVSTEELLCTERAFTYADLYAMLGNGSTVAWLTPHAAVLREGGFSSNYRQFVGDDYRFDCDADGKAISAVACSSEELLEICDVLLRLLAASVVHTVELSHRRCPSAGVSFNDTSMASLMDQCQSLKALMLQKVEFLDEDQIRVLGAHSRPDLEIVLVQCKLRSAGTSALTEILGRNQGPTKLVYCEIDNFDITDGLRGNSRLKSLRPPTLRNSEIGNREVLAIAGALKENTGLVDLDLSYCLLSGETWDLLCNSLKKHPSLQVLHLRFMRNWLGHAQVVPKSRLQTLVDMLKVNMSIHTIHVAERYREHELFRGSVIPYLETNRLRPRVRAIQKARPIAYRAKVLGQALLAARTNPNRFWMFLSGNSEIAIPSTTATISPTVNLPTATAAALPSTTATTTPPAANLLLSPPPTATATSNTAAAVAATYSCRYCCLCFYKWSFSCCYSTVANPIDCQKHKECS